MKYQSEKLHACKVLDRYQGPCVIAKVNVILINVVVRRWARNVAADVIVDAHVKTKIKFTINK